MRILFFALTAFGASSAGAQTHYLDIYNTAPSSVTAFESAPAGSGEFRAAELGERPLHGGGDSTTVAFDGSGGCLRDLRIMFADGRTLEHKAFDVCKLRSYHTGRYWRPAQRGTSVAAQP